MANAPTPGLRASSGRTTCCQDRATNWRWAFWSSCSSRLGLRAAGRALLEGKDAGARTGVEDGRRQGIDGQGIDGEIGQVSVESAPGAARVGALEDAAARGARIENARR